MSLGRARGVGVTTNPRPGTFCVQISCFCVTCCGASCSRIDRVPLRAIGQIDPSLTCAGLRPSRSAGHKAPVSPVLYNSHGPPVLLPALSLCKQTIVKWSQTVWDVSGETRVHILVTMYGIVIGITGVEKGQNCWEEGEIQRLNYVVMFNLWRQLILEINSTSRNWENYFMSTTRNNKVLIFDRVPICNQGNCQLFEQTDFEVQITEYDKTVVSIFGTCRHKKSVLPGHLRKMTKHKHYTVTNIFLCKY